MSKAVLISIQPKWCELILSGKKTLEVRKTKPKLETPFKVYIYCTQGDALALPCLNAPKYTIHRMDNGTLNGRRMTAEERVKSDYAYANGKVIGEFICDSIASFKVFENGSIQDFVLNNLHLSYALYENLAKYVGKGHIGYAWRISDLIVYDIPRALCRFNHPHYKDCDIECGKCKYGYPTDECLVDGYICDRALQRPPQSWCYVEECEENA